MKILITGGAGFIGAYAARALQYQGHEVVLLDDFNEFLYPAALKRLRLKELFADVTQPRVVEMDLLDGEKLQALCKAEKFDVVLHLAAYANPAYSLAAEELYTRVNVLGTLNMLKAATDSNVQRFVFAGSSSVYNDEQTPFTEDSYPLRPRSPYGASKAAAETYCAMWQDLHGLPITVLRFFSVYGPWGRPDMAPLMFAYKILNKKPIQLNRDDRQRDFTYIDDVVSGTVAALQLDSAFDIINIGRGEPTSVRALVVALENATGEEAIIEERDVPPGEMKVTYADISKAARLLNYQPAVSVDAGTARLVDWLRQWQDTINLYPT